MLNEQIRDNLAVLKVTRDSFGRFSELSSATVADLSAANLTGLAVAGANVFTARNRWLGAGRLVVPVGADKWTGTKGVDAAGVWVEGDYLHHIAADKTTEYRWLGSSLGAPGGGARPGSLWIEGAHLHYIDESGVERYAYSLGTSGHSDAMARAGSLWVETFVHGIGESGLTEYPFHADVLHGDATPHGDSTSHTDSGPHSDSTTHVDYGAGHLDYTAPYQDHNDAFYPGTHLDHTDHSDYNDHTDHSDHADTGPHYDSYPHTDHTDHSDSPTYNLPVVV